MQRPLSVTSWTVCALFVLALALRVYDLERMGLGHPENYVPGIAVPRWVEDPPPRTDLAGILRGTLRDGHPPAYFLAMHAWEQLFGTSLTALRLPSAICGALCVPLVMAIASRGGGAPAALLAGLLLALHAFHLHWSQLARMYAFAAMLMLASTWLLLRMLESPPQRHTRWLRAAYVLVTAVGLWTQIYCWPLLFAQMIWAAVTSLRQARVNVALRAQWQALILGAPVVVLSIYQNPVSDWREPALEYLQLGNLFSSTLFFSVPARQPLVPLPALIALTIGLLLLALRRHAGGERPSGMAEAPPSDSPTTLAQPPVINFVFVLSALLIAGLMLAFALYAPRHGRYRPLALCLASAFPLLVVGLAALEARVWPRVLEWRRRWRSARLLELLDQPALLLALLPFACMVLLLVARGTYVARGALLFVPFLIWACAIGMARIWRWQPVAGLLTLALALLVQLDALRHARDADATPIDYRGLAVQLNAELRPGDLILVRNNFQIQPLFYYTRQALSQYVHRERNVAVQRQPEPRRVWCVSFGKNELDPALREAVGELQETLRLTARGAQAILFASR